jgi:hypothetical protein
MVACAAGCGGASTGTRPLPPAKQALTPSIAWTNLIWIENSQNSWPVALRVGLDPPANPPEMFLRFEFVRVSETERALIDGDQLISRRIRIEQVQPLVESLVVSFVDPATQRVLPETTVNLVLLRAHGFSAGEYQVTVRNANAQPLAEPVTLRFEGNNPVIDRRSMAGFKK